MTDDSVEGDERHRQTMLLRMMSKKLTKVLEQFETRLDPYFMHYSLMNAIVAFLLANGDSPAEVIQNAKDMLLRALQAQLDGATDEQKDSIH